MDSENFIETTLKKFELLTAGLDNDRITETIAKIILELPVKGVKVAALVGGAASGKSTFSRTIIEQLAKLGLKADKIATDDFNRADRAWRWQNFEKEGVDPIGKYDFELMNRKIEAIKQNDNPDETVAVPTYNQATGLAIDEGEENYSHRIGKVDVLIVEGDFLHVDEPDLIIYLHVPDDQRLQNRVTRDIEHRGGDPAKTTASFNLRQNVQHFPHTLPSIEKADYIIKVNAAEKNWLYDIYRSVKEVPTNRRGFHLGLAPLG